MESHEASNFPDGVPVFGEVMHSNARKRKFVESDGNPGMEIPAKSPVPDDVVETQRMMRINANFGFGVGNHFGPRTQLQYGREREYRRRQRRPPHSNCASGGVRFEFMEEKDWSDLTFAREMCDTNRMTTDRHSESDEKMQNAANSDREIVQMIRQAGMPPSIDMPMVESMTVGSGHNFEGFSTIQHGDRVIPVLYDESYFKMTTSE